MHLADIIYYLNQSLGKKELKFLLIGCFIIFFILTVVVITAVVFAFKYQTEIYAFLAKIFNFVFNDSLDNVFRNLVRLIIDNLIK